MTADTLSNTSQASVEAYAAIRKMILDLDIPAATRINIGGLARELALSTTPVREAMMRLEGDGLIDRVGNKGFRTPPLLTQDELMELFEFRIMVEPWAARRAATNPLANPSRKLLEEIDSIGSMDQIMKDSVEAGSNLSLVSHDMRFHDLIMAAAGNEMIRKTYSRLHFHFHCFRLFPNHPGIEHTVDEHIRIQEAILSGDGDRAEQAMRDHLTSAYQRFSSIFEKQRVSN